MLHIDSVTGKLSIREFTGGAAGSLRPAELKTAGLLANMVAVHCRCAIFPPLSSSPVVSIAVPRAMPVPCTMQPPLCHLPLPHSCLSREWAPGPTQGWPAQQPLRRCPAGTVSCTMGAGPSPAP